MRRRKFRAPTRKTQRRWRVPPALTHGEGDAFEGLSVLDEVPGELGLVLWQSLRDTMLWGQSSEAERDALFSRGAEGSRLAGMLAASAPAELEGPLQTIAALAGRYTHVAEEHVALACRQVAQWAESRGRLATALAFAQSAALVASADPAGAFAVGRLAGTRQEPARAESWYRRSVALARQAGDWATYAQAFIGLGALYAARGNLGAARRFLSRAARAASRNTLHDLQGSALHAHSLLGGEARDAADATQLAGQALAAYAAGHPRLPELAGDLAQLWNRQGWHAPAARVVRAALPRAAGGAMRIRLLGALGQACGASGDRPGFQQAWDEASEVEGALAGRDSSAGAWLELGQGALALSLWERAEDAAVRAREAAGRRGELDARTAAAALGEAARMHQRPAAASASPADAGEAEALAEALSEALQG